MWNLINKTNEQRKKRQKNQTLNYREQTGGCQRGGWVGVGEIAEGGLE